jgi:hypothetical protein
MINYITWAALLILQAGANTIAAVASNGVWIVKYITWAALLILQAGANTFISRARNSGSYSLHAIAAVASNGVWIVQQFIALDILLGVIHSGSWRSIAIVGAFYTTCTVVGSVGMHYIGKTYIEKGKRKVGA